MDTTMYQYHISEEFENPIKEYDKIDAKMYQYHVFEEYVFNSEIGNYRTYGIELTSPNGTIDRISDISVYKMDVERMVADFNRYQLSSVHFQEVVEDML